MDPTTTYCPIRPAPPEAKKDQRFLCTECHKMLGSATTGTAFYRLRTSAETVSLVLTLMAHGCPLREIVVAFGYEAQ